MWTIAQGENRMIDTKTRVEFLRHKISLLHVHYADLISSRTDHIRQLALVKGYTLQDATLQSRLDDTNKACLDIIIKCESDAIEEISTHVISVEQVLNNILKDTEKEPAEL